MLSEPQLSPNTSPHPNRVNDFSEVSFESLMPSCCTDKSQALVPGWQWPLTSSLKVSHPTGLCEQTRHGPHPRVLVSPPWLLPGAGPTDRLLRKHLQRPTVPLKSEAKTLLSKGSKTAFANSKGSHPFEESPESRKWNGMRATGRPRGAQTSSPGRDLGGHKAAQAGRGRAQPCYLPRSGQEVLLWCRPAGSAVFSDQDSNEQRGLRGDTVPLRNVARPARGPQAAGSDPASDLRIRPCPLCSAHHVRAPAPDKSLQCRARL